MGPFTARTGGEPEPAEYYSSETDLYRVEQLARGRALVEDCRTGDLIDVPVAYLQTLRPVRRHGAGRAAA